MIPRFFLSAATVAFLALALVCAALAHGTYWAALLVGALLLAVAGSITLASLVRVTRVHLSR